jgi:hypothetical protein
MPNSFLLALLSLLLASVASAAPRIPMSIPIRLEANQVVRFTATLTRHRFYYLDLGILFHNADERIKARSLIGEATPVCRALNECGEDFKVNITIRSGGEIIVQQDREGIGHYRYTGRGYFRRILEFTTATGRLRSNCANLAIGRTSEGERRRTPVWHR